VLDLSQEVHHLLLSGLALLLFLLEGLLELIYLLNELRVDLILHVFSLVDLVVEFLPHFRQVLLQIAVQIAVRDCLGLSFSLDLQRHLLDVGLDPLRQLVLILQSFLLGLLNESDAAALSGVQFLLQISFLILASQVLLLQLLAEFLQLGLQKFKFLQLALTSLDQR